jgi:hypothetical protein
LHGRPPSGNVPINESPAVLAISVQSRRRRSHLVFASSPIGC